MVAGSGYAGWLVRGQVPPVYYPVPYPVEVPVIEYVEKPVIVYETVEVPIEVIREVVEYVDRYPDHELFQDVAEFTEWFDRVTVIILQGDCDDWGEAYSMMAANDGYLLAYQYINKDGILGDTLVMPGMSSPHMGLLMMTQEDKIYYIEPQPPTFRIIYICDRD